MKINAKIINQDGRAKLLAALFSASKPQGMGMLHFRPGDMDEATAKRLMDDGDGHFDYLQGRVMKLDLSGPSHTEPDGSLWLEFDAWGYDRDNGEGAALGALLASGLEANKAIAPAAPKI